MDFVEELERLNALRKEGALSEDEYAQAKESLLAKNQPAEKRFQQAAKDLSTNANTWAMLIHLSQFCAFMLPLAGLIVPIVLWQIKKDESEIIDQHGRIVVNWLITELILSLIFIPLCFLLIGIPLLIALGVVGTVFPIIGAVKANNGEVWKYPCSIRFF